MNHGEQSWKTFTWETSSLWFTRRTHLNWFQSRPCQSILKLLFPAPRSNRDGFFVFKDLRIRRWLTQEAAANVWASANGVLSITGWSLLSVLKRDKYSIAGVTQVKWNRDYSADLSYRKAPLVGTIEEVWELSPLFLPDLSFKFRLWLLRVVCVVLSGCI